MRRALLLGPNGFLQLTELTYERPDPDSHRFGMHSALGDERMPDWLPKTLEDVTNFVRRDAAHWERFNYGPWVLKQADLIVGRAGLQLSRINGRAELEIAWAVAPDNQKQGIATAAARTALEWAFGELGFTEIVAITQPDNVASLRVMEKIGLVYVRDIEHYELAHVLYRRAK